MKILINENNKTRISIWIPLFVLKSKLLSKVLLRRIDQDLVKEQKVHNELIKFGPVLYKEIKKVIKTHGHINIVEVTSKNGDKVIVKI